MSSIVKNLIEYVGISEQIPINYSVNAFKELMLQENITLNECFPNIEQITRVTACVEIKNYYVVDTPVSQRNARGEILNPSGQTLTGKKLVIEGVVHQSIHYVADNCEQNVMVVDNSYCFGTFVVLPKSATQNSCYTVIPYIEDIIAEAIGPRDITKCVSLFLEVK